MVGTTWTPSGPHRSFSTPSPTKRTWLPPSTSFGGYASFPTSPPTSSVYPTPPEPLSGLPSRPYDTSLLSLSPILHITELSLPAYLPPTLPAPASPHDPFHRAEANVWSKIPDNIVSEITDILLLLAPADDVVAFGRVNRHLHRAVGRHLRQLVRYKVTPVKKERDYLEFGAPCVGCVRNGCSFVTAIKSITMGGFPNSTPINFTAFLTAHHTALQRLDIQSLTSHIYTLTTHLPLPSLIHFSGPIPDLVFLQSLASSPNLQFIDLTDRTPGGPQCDEFAAMLLHLGEGGLPENKHVGLGVRKVKLTMGAKGRYGWDLVNVLVFWPEVKELVLVFEQDVAHKDHVKPLPWHLLEPIFNNLPHLESIHLLSSLHFPNPNPTLPIPSISPPLKAQPSPIFLHNLANRLKERRLLLLRFNKLSLGNGSPGPLEQGTVQELSPLKRVRYKCVWKEGRREGQGWRCEVALVPGKEENVGKRETGFVWEGQVLGVVEPPRMSMREDTSPQAIPLDELSQTLQWMLDQKISGVQDGLVELVEFGGVEQQAGVAGRSFT